jgi:chromosome segregation ATPase
MLQSTKMTELDTEVDRPSTERDVIMEMQNQIQNLCQALKEKDVESKGLKKALRLYQKETKNRVSLHPNLESQRMTTHNELMMARKVVEQETDVVVGLRYELSQKNQELDFYKKENEQLRRRVIGLEIDLDTHDIHMTDYAERQCQLEEGMFEDDVGESKTTEDVLNNEQRHGSRIQDLIARQIIDYSTLEDRYKLDQTENRKKISDLKSTIANLEASVVVLESRLSGEKSVKFSLKPNSNIYKERINVLETTNARLIASTDHLMERIALLESRLNRPSRLIQEAEQIGETTSHIDKRLWESRRKIAFLTKDIELKEKRLSLLRAEAIAYQFRNLPPSDFSTIDPCKSYIRPVGDKDETLKSDEESKGGYMEYKSTTHLKEQLQTLQQVLIRKDREIEELQQISLEREHVLSIQLDAARDAIGDMKVLGRVQFFL